MIKAPARVVVLVLAVILAASCLDPAKAQESHESHPSLTAATGETEELASSSDSGSEAKPGPFLFRGHAKPGCSGFMITEFSISGTLDQRRPTADVVYGVDVGAMKNTDERFAFGGTIHGSFAFYDSREHIYGRLALKPRLRYWLDRSIGLDVSPGLLVQPGGLRAALGFIGQVAVSFGDYGSVTGQIEVIDSPFSGRNQTAGYAGIRFGSYVGTAVGALPVLVALISVVA
jgi:hypothetical protein